MSKKNAPTPEEFAAKMNDIIETYKSIEDCHAEMDLLMCKTLEALGYIEGVRLFRAKPKWYA